MKHKIQLFKSFLESIVITDDNRDVMEAILEATNIASQWYFAKDINGDTKYKGNYTLAVENDDQIPPNARKQYGLLVMPNFTSNTVFSTQGTGTVGNASMNSYS